MFIIFAPKAGKVNIQETVYIEIKIMQECCNYQSESVEDLSKPILFERTKITRYKECDFCFVHLSIVLMKLLSNWSLNT